MGGEKYELFHSEHITIMILCICLIVAGCILYRRLSSSGKPVMRRCMAAGMILLIALRQLYVCLAGDNIIYDLPLHLCSIAGFVCFVYEYFGKAFPEYAVSVLRQAVFAVLGPGAVMAIVFTDGTMYPPIHFITIESNLFHTLIILYTVILLMDGEIVPAVREAYKSLIFLCIVAVPVYIFDRHFRANYMFLLNPSVGSPFTSVYNRYGYGAYMAAFGVTVIAEIVLINLLFQKMTPGDGVSGSKRMTSGDGVSGSKRKKI